MAALHQRQREAAHAQHRHCSQLDAPRRCPRAEWGWAPGAGWCGGAGGDGGGGDGALLRPPPLGLVLPLLLLLGGTEPVVLGKAAAPAGWTYLSADSTSAWEAPARGDHSKRAARSHAPPPLPFLPLLPSSFLPYLVATRHKRGVDVAAAVPPPPPRRPPPSRRALRLVGGWSRRPVPPPSPLQM